MFDRLSHYNVLGRLGAGGMGELYRARDTHRGRTVALRVVSPQIRDDADRRAAFLRDAERAAALSHPNIVTLYEIGEDQGQLFAAFEFAPGDSLASLIAAGPINPRRAVQAAAQVADAIADGHAHGLVHGAIDADHIVLTPKGTVKVLDFGLVRWNSAATAPALEGDPRDDLSALGVLLQDMARGATPGARRALPEIDRLVAKALCDDPDERYDSAATFAADLRAVDQALSQPAAADARETIPAHAISRRRPSWVRLAAGFGALALVAVVGWAARDTLARTWRRTVASPPRPVVAVLPFDQPGAGRTYLSVGVAQDLAAKLGQTPGVQVVGRTATTRQDAGSAADRRPDLDAAVLLDGSVRPAAGALEITVRLIESSTSDVIWHGDYRREAKDVFPLQSQIADDVARAIGVTVTPTAAGERAAARLVDPAAYDAYLQGRQAVRDGHISDAETWLTRAVQLDDGLAEAHASLAVALMRTASLDAPGADAARTRAKAAADRSLELAPDLPAANVAVALTADAIPDALAALKSAIRYDPSDAAAYREIGDLIQDFDPDRAAAIHRKALALDPGLNIDAVRSDGWSADSCEATVLMADEENARRPAESVRRRMAAAVDAATGVTAGPYVLRCAALSAAGLGNAAAAAALISRIATNEPALRVWSTRTGGVTGSAVLRGGVFPWSRVEHQNSFKAAVRALSDACDRVRRQIALALDDVGT